jgi:hypothetical protein
MSLSHRKQFMIVLGEETELPEDGTRHRKSLEETRAKTTPFLSALHIRPASTVLSVFPSGKSDPAKGKAH